MIQTEAAGGRQPWKAVVAVAATEPALPQVALEAAAVSAAMPPAARPQYQQHLPPQPLQQPQDWNSAHEPAALPAGWRQAVAPDGRTYYENDMTKVTQWEHPAAAVADGGAYDQMATTKADWPFRDCGGGRMIIDVYADCRKFWSSAAQSQVAGPPQTFLAGGAHGSGAGVIDPLRIFVGGLCVSVDDASLGAYFGKFGTVYSANVMQAPGVAGGDRSRGGG